MKKTVKFLAAVMAVSVSILSFASCKEKVKDYEPWTDSLESAKKEAAEKDKMVLLFFSGDDWDGQKSVNFKAQCIETDTFLAQAGEKYALCELNYSKERYDLLNNVRKDPKSATKEEKKEAKLIEKEYQVKDTLNVTYNRRNTFPSIYIMTPEGYSIASIWYDENVYKTPEDILQALELTEIRQSQVKSLLNTISSSSGLEKAEAIDELYQSTPIELRNTLNPFLYEFLEADKDNETGKLGDYEWEIAYNESSELRFQKGDVKAAVERLIDPKKTKHYSPDNYQLAYYQYAYINASAGTASNEEILEYLNKSLEANPESENSGTIRQAIGFVQLQIDAEKKQAADAEEAKASEETETKVPEEVSESSDKEVKE